MSRRIHGQRKAVSAKKLKKSNAHHKATRKMLQSGEDGGIVNMPPERKVLPFDDYRVEVIAGYYCKVCNLTEAIYPKYKLDNPSCTDDDFLVI